MSSCLVSQKEEKGNYLEACIHQLWHFSPFVCSIYGLLDKDTKITLKGIANILVEKWWQICFRTCGKIKSRSTITSV